jgi:hypothetical protein
MVLLYLYACSKSGSRGEEYGGGEGQRQRFGHLHELLPLQRDAIGLGFLPFAHAIVKEIDALL